MAKTETVKINKVIKKARVLSAFTLHGAAYRPDQIIEADEQTINALVGQVDPHPDAVAYIEGLK